MKKILFSLATLAISTTAMSQTQDFTGLMEAPAKAATEADVIWTPPCVTDGHAYTMTFEAGMKGFSRVGLTDVNIDVKNGIKAEIVGNTRGDEYYIKNPLPRTAIGSYIEGKLVEDENTEDIYIECKLPQWLNAREATNTGVCLSLGTKTVNPDGSIFYEPLEDESNNLIRYVADENEDFSLSLPEGVALCAFYRYLDEESIGVFAGSAVTYVNYVEPGRKLATVMPEGIEAENWGMLYSNDDKAHPVTVGIDSSNNKIYIAGFTPDFPESCITGTIDGEKIIFEANQYIGETDATYEYFVLNKAEFRSTSDRGDVYDFPGSVLPSVEAVYDTEEHTISCPMDIAWFCNAGTDQLYYSSYFVGPMFLPNKGGAATPVNPEIIEVMNYMPEFGYGGFLADMPLLGTNAEVLDKNNYTYIVYFDGEPYTFSPEEYPGVTTPMTEIPYDFEDGESEDFRVEGISHIVCWRTDGFEELGVQAVYTVNGVSNRSEVVTYKLNNTGINTATMAQPVSIEFYDLSGARILNPGKGIYLKKVKFDNGKTIVTKVAVK